MELRLLLAVVLSFVVFTAWGTYISKKDAEYLKTVQQKETRLDKKTEQKGLPENTFNKKVDNLPPQNPDFFHPEIVKSEEIKDIFIETDLYEIILSNEGASFKNLKLKKHLNKKKLPLDLVTQTQSTYRPPYLSTADTQMMDLLNFSTYRVEANSSVFLSKENPEKMISFELETPSGLKIKKEFTFYYDKYHIGIDVSLTDKNGDLANKKYYVNWGPGLGNEKVDKKARYTFIGPISYLDEEITKYKPDEIQNESDFSGNLAWLGLQNKYFTSTLIPQNGIDTGRISKNPDNKISIGLQLINKTDRSINGHILLFAGPKDERHLNSYNIHLEKLIDFGWFGNKFSFLVNPIFKALRFFYKYTHNYGVSIILVTIIVKLIFFPLSQKSYKSMKDMQKIQPYIKIIQERYKDDKAQLNQEMMRIYKEHKINPLGGCLPMVFQIPVFIALYNVLLVSIELRGAPFVFWIIDLSEKDPYYVTPIIMGITMLIQQKMTPSVGDPTQAKIMMFLPLVFTFMFLNFPVGLVIYWLVNNVLSISQQYYMNHYVNA